MSVNENHEAEWVEIVGLLEQAELLFIQVLSDKGEFLEAIREDDKKAAVKVEARIDVIHDMKSTVEVLVDDLKGRASAFRAKDRL